MAYTESDKPQYYPENYDYSAPYHDEFGYNNFNNNSPKFWSSVPENNLNAVLPTVDYLNERKCPIYIHDIKKDSSVYNNYNQKNTVNSKARNLHTQKMAGVQNSSKFILDKLEESYWAMWKPKNENVQHKFYEDEEKMSEIRLHSRGTKKLSNNARGDTNDNLVKHFKAKKFISNSSTASWSDKEAQLGVFPKIHSINSTIESKKSSERYTRRKPIKPIKKDPVSEEIQTDAHYPVILKETETTLVEIAVPEVKQTEDPVVEEVVVEEVVPEIVEKEVEKKPVDVKRSSEKSLQKHKKSSPRHKKTHSRNTKKTNNETAEAKPANNDDTGAFIDHKDSIIITKEKQDKVEKKYYQQPKCIRLYRKSGGGTYIKGGTYPLKSCLKRDIAHPKGNFRLGAPGSPLFVTSGSFLNNKRK
ncbi:uncharacterized protein LOC115874543 [Sitophilus oryzae]|uniref:Uncharacterized protein LOC115874543 n=1 Tax=Sitophilus oryzae TaxID=7048 RepID=A0A6J2X2Z1_SITOR|nr:uncharacterized protein LOC115874543 [Sitophilus oryzae]